jgi:hypothetical protein
MSASLRGQLKSIRILLEQTLRDRERIGTDDALGVSLRVQEVIARIEPMPQVNLVRDTIIELHNLVMSLRRPEVSTSLASELESAMETVQELLDDPMFGYTADELRGVVDTALRNKGVHACSACKQTELTIELAYMMIKPFPLDPAQPAGQLPCAMVVCRSCGLWWMHDLAVLGVL